MDMLRWIITFFLLAIAAGILGFTDVQIVSVEIAQTLFKVFLILLIISIVINFLTGRKPPINI